MSQWILERLFATNEQPTPRFALQGAVNWMRALSILVENGSFDDQTIKKHYLTTNRRNSNREADTLVFENMVMAFHNQASLAYFALDTAHPYDVCRAAIICWYYGTYFTCSAMIAAASGTKQETHALTAKVFHSDIVESDLLMPPFSLRLGSLVGTNIESEIAAYRGDNQHDVNTLPDNDDQAWGAVVSYLKGTGEYEKWRVGEKIKSSREFKALGVNDFRTKKARELRDEQLGKNWVNFLTQAIRYRGKANYRDSIFLSYGDDNSQKMKIFLQDLEKVSQAFQRMVACYLSRRVEKNAWREFVADLRAHSRLSLEPQYLEI